MKKLLIILILVAVLSAFIVFAMNNEGATGRVVGQSSNPNPLIGLLIVAGVSVIALAAFFGISRMNK